MERWERVWEFNTARFTIVGEVTPCDTDPRDHFEFPEDIEAVESGRVSWFDARVRVLLDGEEVGSDYLGCCAYDTPEELFRHHATLTAELRQLRGKTDRKSRLARKQLKECLTNNASLNPPVVYCEYGPSMVSEAIEDARKTLARYATVKLRT